MMPCLLAALLLSGCQPKAEPEGPKQIKIAVYDENSYKHEFRPYFEGNFPNWDITLLPMDDLKLFEHQMPEAVQLFNDFLEREKPDLLIMSSLLYKPMADKGALRDLSEWMSRHDIDTNAFAPGVIDILKDNEEGKLFGLSPNFRTAVLYYNKTMFRTYGIEEPHDRMTWSEVLQLSDRFMQDRGLDKGSYGFYESGIRTPFDLVQIVAETEGLSYADNRNAKMTMQSAEWRTIWNLVADCYRRGSLGTNQYQLKVVDGVTYVNQKDKDAMDLFYQGKTAMSFGQVDMMQRLEGTPPAFEWGVFSGPVSQRDPERVWWFVIDYVFAIPTVSAQPDEAWKAIEYFHSDKMGKIYASASQSLFSLKEFPNWKNDPKYDVFYKQRGWPSKPNFMSSRIPTTFYEPFNKLVASQMDATIAGKVTADEALTALQTEGQALIDQLLVAKE
jgi:multiple sugar transport system substrate-binding protein